MVKRMKKGFTLVELLVVIAILAILATVSVVGYTAFIKKANVSNDQSMIGMINKNLEAEFVTNKPTSASQAILALNGLGFSNEKLVAYTEGYHYAYNLEENKFYLVDNEDNVVYPDTCEKEKLWGLYNDGGEADMIFGVNQYVLTVSPTKVDNFKAAFGSGNYKIDLNNLYLGISSGNDSNIFVSNGGVGPELSFDGDASSIRTYKKAPSGPEVRYESLTTDGIISGNVATFDGYAFSGNNINFGDYYKNVASSLQKYVTSVKFENCIFTDGNSINNFGWEYDQSNTTIREVVFENCTFSNTGHISVNKNFVKLIVKNCTFNNCTAGISLAGAEGSLIEGNTFRLSGTSDDDGFVIQIHEPLIANSVKVTVRNNVIESATKFVLVGRVSKVDDEVTAFDFNKYIVFENNTYPNDLVKAVGHTSYVGKYTEEHVKQVANLVK